MHLCGNWLEADESVCVVLHHGAVSVPSIKGYYLCCCCISFSCDADVVQGGSFMEKSICKHILLNPPWAPLGQVLSCECAVCIRVCVCVLGRQQLYTALCALIVIVQRFFWFCFFCFFFFPSEKSFLFRQVNNSRAFTP